jgi:hypothetical protein
LCELVGNVGRGKWAADAAKDGDYVDYVMGFESFAFMHR